MNLSELFPRKYATGEDLMGKPLTLTISSCVLETMSSGAFSASELKPVVYFSEIKKGVVLNKTLAFQIAEILGTKETEQWAGKPVTLYPEPITVAGRSRIAIRARVPDLTAPHADSLAYPQAIR